MANLRRLAGMKPASGNYLKRLMGDRGGQDALAERAMTALNLPQEMTDEQRRRKRPSTVLGDSDPGGL